MKIHSLGDGKPTGYATWGCLWERGRCHKETDYLVRGENGVCPSQVRMGAYWPDGSVKWTFHTADAGELGREAEVSPIGPGEEAAPDGSRRLKLKESEEEIVLKGLYLTVHVPKDGRRIFSKICYEGKVCLKEGEAVLQTEEPFFDKNRKGVFFRNYTGRIQ